jgi:sulfite exporter TauE/SafE
VELTLLAALAMGLLGSVHCAGMCGGIACALTLGLPLEVRRSAWRMLPWLLAYNAGRITSYAAAGALAGLLGAGLMGALPLEDAQRLGRMVSAAFLILAGLYLGGWWRALAVLEHAGTALWRRLEPLGRRLLPVATPWQALAVGSVWGWLPCGLVYAALLWSLAAGGAARGALLMGAFGLGTLPMLLGAGALSRWLLSLSSRVSVRRTAGLLIIVLGLNGLLAAAHAGHAVHALHGQHAQALSADLK